MGRRRGFDGEDVRWIAPNQVRRDPVVNRHFEEPRARRIAKAYDPKRARSAGYVVSERRNGDLIWLDGQHRGSAAEFVGEGDAPVPMNVLTGLTKSEEAEWVLLFQEDRKRTLPVDAHRLGVQARRTPDLIVDAVCKKHRLRVSSSSAEGSLAAVATARRVAAAEDGARVLDQTLGTLISAYGRGAEAFEGPVLRGLAYVFQMNNGDLDHARLVKKLARYPGGASGLHGQAEGLRTTEGGSLWRSAAKAIVLAYNRGLRSRQLPPV